MDSTPANSHCGLSSVPYWMRTPLKLSQNLMRRVVCSSSWQPDCRNPMKMVAWKVAQINCSHKEYKEYKC